MQHEALEQLLQYLTLDPFLNSLHWNVELQRVGDENAGDEHYFDRLVETRQDQFSLKAKAGTGHKRQPTSSAVS